MSLRWILPLACLLIATACARSPVPQTSADIGAETTAEPVVQRKPQAQINWSPVRLEAGNARIDCSADYRAGDGLPVLSLAYLDLRKIMQACRATGLMRLRYSGKITPSFAALAERAGKVATDLGIGKRILDIDSAGGYVEAAFRAGDAIGENDWAIWVRGDSVCYSACVLLLAAGDMRVIVGPVGIHRMIRLHSSATSRKELGEELERISQELRAYLQRNGASAKVFDLMTTVPNRTLQILTDEELENYGLSGANAVEDDLDRIRLVRRCGTDFLRRRDAFRRAYEQQCLHPTGAVEQDVVDINSCGLTLRKQFGFPDPACPIESPMAELDGAILAIIAPEPTQEDAVVAPDAGQQTPGQASSGNEPQEQASSSQNSSEQKLGNTASAAKDAAPATH